MTFMFWKSIVMGAQVLRSRCGGANVIILSIKNTPFVRWLEQKPASVYGMSVLGAVCGRGTAQSQQSKSQLSNYLCKQTYLSVACKSVASEQPKCSSCRRGQYVAHQFSPFNKSCVTKQVCHAGIFRGLPEVPSEPGCSSLHLWGEGGRM